MAEHSQHPRRGLPPETRFGLLLLGVLLAFLALAVLVLVTA